MAAICRDYFYLAAEVRSAEGQYYKRFALLLSAPMALHGPPQDPADLDLDTGITIPTSLRFQTLGEELLSMIERNRQAQNSSES